MNQQVGEIISWVGLTVSPSDIVFRILECTQLSRTPCLQLRTYVGVETRQLAAQTWTQQRVPTEIK